MPQAKSSIWRPLKPVVLILGLSTVLVACQAHDSGRRGPAYYSDRHHWNDGDRHRRDRQDWRHDRRHDDRDRYRDRRRWGDR